jgi:hypothetical protein
VDSALAYFVFGACGLFVAVYTLAARSWWRSRVGLAMGLRDIVIALAFLPQVLHAAIGVTLAVAWFHWYWRASLAALGLVTLWRGWVIWSMQRRGARPLSPSD